MQASSSASAAFSFDRDDMRTKEDNAFFSLVPNLLLSRILESLRLNKLQVISKHHRSVRINRFQGGYVPV